MSKLLIALLLLFSIQLFSQKITKNEYKPQYSTILISNNGEKMLTQCSRSVPNNIESYFDLTKEDTALLENNLRKILSVKSTGCCLKGWNIERLEDYAYQYIGVIIKNRRYIYINAFLVNMTYGQDSFETLYKEWRTKPIIMCDGSDGFWGALFNLENKSFSQLSVNGGG